MPQSVQPVPDQGPHAPPALPDLAASPCLPPLLALGPRLGDAGT